MKWVLLCRWYNVPGATLCGTIIFSFGSPGTYILQSPFVTKRRSGASLAFLIRNLISLLTSPALDEGVLPDIRWVFAALQESLLSCAWIQAALLKNVLCTWFAPRNICEWLEASFGSRRMSLWCVTFSLSSLWGAITDTWGTDAWLPPGFCSGGAYLFPGLRKTLWEAITDIFASL